MLKCYLLNKIIVMEKKIVLLVFLFSVLVGCDSGVGDSPIPEDRITLTELDKEVGLQRLITSFQGGVRGAANLNHVPSIFDRVNWSKVRKMIQPSLNRTAYAAAAWGIDESGLRYLENLVVVERDKRQYGYIVKYSPTENWLSTFSLKRDIDKFNGKIEIFDLNYNKIGNIEINNNDDLSIRSSSDCETVLEVTYWETISFEDGSWVLTNLEWTETEYCYSEADNESGWNGDNYEGDSLEPNDDGGNPGIPFIEPEIEDLVDQDQFIKEDYQRSSMSKKISQSLNYIRYARKNNKVVDLNKAFTNIPQRASNGFPFESFSGFIKLNNRTIHITLTEFPLDSDYRVFQNSIGEIKDVMVNGELHYNIRYNRVCSGCAVPLGAFLIQVPASDYQVIIDFLDGK